MLAGHVATALIARTRVRAASTGTFMLAAVLADLLAFVLVLIGIERIEFLDGRGAAQYFHPLDISFSHSLLGGLACGALLAAVLIAAGLPRRAAGISAFLVMSHWVLDVISHPPDMPLAPGVAGRLGLGLWTSVPATVVVEGGLWLAALVVFARGAGGGLGRRSLYWIGAAVITVVWYGNIAGPPPPNPSVAPLTSLLMFALIVAWGYAIDSMRFDTTQLSSMPHGTVEPV
jgi:hypothetical protein